MSTLLAAIFSTSWATIAAGAFACLSFILLLLNRLKKAKAKNEDLEEYQNTRKRLDKIGRMSDADAAREWLRDRGERKGDL